MMKDASHRTTPSPLRNEALWWIAVLALAAAGHWGGQVVGSALHSTVHTPGNASVARAADADENGEPGHRSRPTGTPSLSKDEIKRRVKKVLSSTGYLAEDWEAQAELRPLLASLDSEDLALMFGQRDAELMRDIAFKYEVLKAWLNKDPAAAISAAVGNSSVRGRYILSATWSEWCGDHAEEALTLLDSPGLPDTVKEKRSFLLERALSSQLGRNFDLVEKTYARLSPQETYELIGSLGQEAYDNPQLREKLTQLAAENGSARDQEQLQATLVRNLSRESPDKAAAYLDSPSIPEPAREAVQDALAASRGAQGFSDWATAHEDTRELPASLANGFNDWALSQPQEVRDWLSQRPEGTQRDLFSLEAIGALARRGEYESAAEVISGIGDPELHQEAESRLRALKELSQAVKPQ